MRDAFVRKLTEEAETNEDVMLLVGDLGFGVVAAFGDAYPKQFLNCGVAEQSMVGVAAGLAASGRRPFVYSISNFPSLRPLEQIRNDVCYHGLGVTLVAVGTGLAYGALGYTHHGVEDMSILRSLPGMRVYTPADALECAAAVDEILADPSPAYLRLGKNKEPLMHDEQPDLSTGAPLLIREGTDVTVIAAGPIITQALAVAEELEPEGVSVRVLTCPVIKPLNAEAVHAAATGTAGIVTLEEHTVLGGFGSAVLEGFALQGYRTPVLPLGLADAATHIIGGQEWIRERAGLSTDHVRSSVAAFARRNA
ncbi:MAG: transketolase [Actinomycetales bacterium]|nr:transketolase [Actinomycetales bacterium]